MREDNICLNFVRINWFTIFVNRVRLYKFHKELRQHLFLLSFIHSFKAPYPSIGKFIRVHKNEQQRHYRRQCFLQAHFWDSFAGFLFTGMPASKKNGALLFFVPGHRGTGYFKVILFNRSASLYRRYYPVLNLCVRWLRRCLSYIKRSF